MKTIDPKDRLEGDWEPSQLPDLRPDAPAVEPPKLRVLPPEAPSLCEQGPCIHFHRLVTELDAQKPLDFSDASSKSHRMLTCYPSSGIEFALDGPVFDCNLWDPGEDNEKIVREQRRDGFMRSEAGIAYAAELEAWKVDQERIKREEEETAAPDITELDTIGELRATMDDNDVLEVRLKGGVDILSTVHHDSEITDALIGTTFGPGTYQVRHIRNKRIIAIRTITHEPPTQESPE